MNARLNRLGALVIGATVVACAAPSVAGATDYCVGINTSCAPVNHRGDFQTALTDAAGTPEADRILLGAETYTSGTVAGYVYNAPTSPVEIVGAGIGKTTLTGQAGIKSILDVSGAAGTSVSDLTIHGPANAVGGFTGLSLDHGIARRIEVDEEANQSTYLQDGVFLSGGATLEDSTVTLPKAEAQGIFMDDGHVRRSVVSAGTGITANDGTVERARVKGTLKAIKAYGGTTAISSTELIGGEDCGICASPYAGVDLTRVNADGVVLVLPSADNAPGVYASTAWDPSWNVEVNLTNSVIRGFGQALDAKAAGSGRARINVSYSDYNPSGIPVPTGNASIAAANVSNVGDARFANAAAGDYHLLAGSPLVDAGDPATAQGVDLDGNPLVTDGNGDGTARRDIGAFEAPAVPAASGQPGGGPAAPDIKAPVIAGFRATPALFAIGRAATPRATRVHRGTRFRYTLSESARVTLKIQRRLRGRRARYRTVGRLTRSGRAGANRIRFTGRIGRRALRPGRYRARIRAIDAAGNRSARKATRFRIAR